jgi:hypothetical protein
MRQKAISMLDSLKEAREALMRFATNASTRAKPVPYHRIIVFNCQ